MEERVSLFASLAIITLGWGSGMLGWSGYLDERLASKLLDLCFVLLGLSLIIGSKREWRWLVDPPDEWRPSWNSLRGRRRVTRSELKALATIFGWVMVAVGAMSLLG